MLTFIWSILDRSGNYGHFFNDIRTLILDGIPLHLDSLVYNVPISTSNWSIDFVLQLLGLALMLPVCTYVDIIEYMPSTRLNGRCHYYDEEVRFTQKTTESVQRNNLTFRFTDESIVYIRCMASLGCREANSLWHEFSWWLLCISKWSDSNTKTRKVFMRLNNNEKKKETCSEYW